MPKKLDIEAILNEFSVIRASQTIITVEMLQPDLVETHKSIEEKAKRRTKKELRRTKLRDLFFPQQTTGEDS